MNTRSTILGSALGCAIGLSVGLAYGNAIMDEFETAVKALLVKATEDSYLIGRQSAAYDCLKSGFALLPPLAEQTVPAVLICDRSQLHEIPEEDIEQVTPQLNERPEKLKQKQTI